MRTYYLIADLTDAGSVVHPFHDHVPFYIGLGPEVPRSTFSARGHDYQAVGWFWRTHPLNDFGIAVVMAVRIHG